MKLQKNGETRIMFVYETSLNHISLTSGLTAVEATPGKLPG